MSVASMWLLQLAPAAVITLLGLSRAVDGPGRSFFPLLVALVGVCYGLFVVGVPTTASGRRWLSRHRRQFMLSAGSFVTTFVVAEVVISGLVLSGLWRPTQPSFSLFENSQHTLRFDPIAGYTLTSIPCRTARVSHGMVEFTGRCVGNNLGFPDRHDFGPRPTIPGRRRYAVFGDSFTAAQYLEHNWPDRIEEWRSGSAHPLELLNFSVDGAGLANWWSVLTKIVELGEFQIDGVIFAVFADDLHRRFSVCDHRGVERHMFGRVGSWRPEEFPKTLEEARSVMRPLDAYIVDSERFQQALEGAWIPPGEAVPLPFLTRRIAGIIATACRRLTHSDGAITPRIAAVDERDRLALIEDMARFLRSRSLPVLVVAVPGRSLRPDSPPATTPATAQFAAMLGATLVDGAEAFAGLDSDSIRACWFPYDGHWNQSGSDRFARWLDGVLDGWPEVEEGSSSEEQRHGAP